MRDKNLTPEQLEVQLGRNFSRKLENLVLTEAVFVNPNLQYKISLGPLPTKLRKLEALILASYFATDEALGFYLREEIREKITQFDLYDRLRLEILLSCQKSGLIKYLYLDESITERTLFGNIVPAGVEAFNNLKFSRRKLRKPEKPVYRRGYKDKGSRRPESSWLPSEDFTFTEFQNEKERIEDLYKSYLDQVLEILKNEEINL